MYSNDGSYGAMIIFLSVICTILTAFTGYVMNIYKLWACSLVFAEWTTMEIMRLIGIFIPIVGAILGFM